VTTDAAPQTAPRRLTPEELRTLFLFERLTDEQLQWLSDNSRIEDVDAGQVFAEGEPAECFYVMLEGEVALLRRVGPDNVEITRTGQRGVYAGATQAYVDEATQTYTTSMRAVVPSTFLVLPADTFATMMREWFPMAVHLLEGLFLGMRNSQAVVGQRERLVALGSLTAGLTHELNNPAAAAVRATAALRERVAGMRHKLALLADGHLPSENMRELVDLQEEAADRTAKASGELSPMETSDREDALAEWFDAHDVQGGYDLAPVLVAGGLDLAWAEEVSERVPPGLLEGAMRWLAYTVETENLMREIEDSVHRISGLVGAARQYSQMDRAPFQLIDIHDGLKSTLVMLSGKLKGLQVVKEFDRTLPLVPAYPGELNQVWTNLIDNAVAAMAGEGTLTLRTRLDDNGVSVDVVDTGPGIEPEVLGRVFEPFFTTKPVGEGTGLGLDISWRIVVNRHRGDLRVTSQPGETVFTVRLPLTPPAED
jgi:signal transduction histidine kinase